MVVSGTAIRTTSGAVVEIASGIKEVLIDITVDIAVDITTDVAADVAADITIDITNKTELKAWVKIRQPKELKVFNSLRLSIVLLLAICCWDSLKS